MPRIAGFFPARPFASPDAGSSAERLAGWLREQEELVLAPEEAFEETEVDPEQLLSEAPRCCTLTTTCISSSAKLGVSTLLRQVVPTDPLTTSSSALIVPELAIVGFAIVGFL
jgi:hypothetical protein